MVFIKATALLSILAYVSAAPVADLETRKVPTGAFGFIAIRSGSPVQYQALSATGREIWLGKKTTTYCPLSPASQCPKGKDTSFYINSASSGMNTVVPGGQQLYIGPDGALGYTQAHSASTPPGSIIAGFKILEDQGTFYLTHCEGGFYACPDTKKTAYKVYVDVKGKLKDKDVPTKKKADCIPFAPRGIYGKDVLPVWQYI
ncbi:hypothetical protein ABW20_dc0106607 [Dactylellina cionopaga]|nr:hypothetical protein ABW20_dc0106607 [Dactylellina cionopaga]